MQLPRTPPIDSTCEPPRQVWDSLEVVSVTVSAIFIYPVKGLHGFRVERAFVERRGLRHDRRWMVVDPQGMFRSQRTLSKMATIRTTVTSDGLVLRQPFSSLCLPLEPSGPDLTVQVWKSEVSARAYGQETDRWLTEALGEPSRLVKMPPESIRPTDPAYSQSGDQVSFADGFPLLLASDSSLDDLNSRMAAPVPIGRFRPNAVVSGSEPWDEDNWLTLQLGELRFRNVKPCGRCLVTTIDQDTGVPTGDEPLRTLGTFRKVGNNANFGVNLIPDEEGWIQVGDQVRVP